MLSQIRKRVKSICNAFLNSLCVDRAMHLGASLLPRDYREKTRIFATTVIRCTKNREMTGFLLELDWASNSVKKKIPIPLDSGHPFWNSRGGNRGGRGISVHNGILYVATALSVLKFDRDLNQIGEITHPHLAGLHEIYTDEEGIWLTSTVHDLVIKLDFEGSILDEWWGSESKVMQREFGFSTRDLRLELDFPRNTFVSEYERYCEEEIFHINAVCSQDGNVYILASRKNAIIQIRPEPERVVLRDNRLRSPHNMIPTVDGKVIVNDTRNQCIRVYKLDSGKRLSALSTRVHKGSIRGSAQFVKAGWQRGLTHIGGSIYLVGTSPASVFEVDINEGAVGQICRIDSDVRHCIHGLLAVRNF